MNKKKDTTEPDINWCREGIRAMKDALDILGGSWKLLILTSLYDGPKRFKEITKDVKGISDKMLSKELKDLETNQLVQRTVYSTFPPTVKYSITDHALTLENILKSLQEWGTTHRKKILS